MNKEDKEDKEIIKETVIIFSSTWEAIELLPSKEKKYRAIKALIEYGIYGIEPHDEARDVQQIIVQALPVMKKAIGRYNTKKNNGKYGQLRWKTFQSG